MQGFIISLLYIFPMGCCKWILIITVIVIAYLSLSPPPQPRQLGTFNPETPADLQNLGVSLDRLSKAHFIDTMSRGPEDIEIDSEGYGYSGLSDGSLIKINLETEEIEKIGQFQGQILGLSMSKNEKLLALATLKGLVLFNLQNRTSRLLVSQHNNQQFQALNSITFVGDDRLYFTVSGTIPMEVFHQELLYRSKDGQVFQHDISTNKTQLVLDSLEFTNGIIYSEKDNCLFVSELNNHQILRLELDAENFMNKSVVISNVLGYPDNLKITEDGYIWAGIPSLRDHVTNFIDGNVVIRNILLNLNIPAEIFLGMANMKYSGGIKIDPRNGEIVDYFFGKPDDIFFVTTVMQKKGYVYLTSLMCNKIAVVKYTSSISTKQNSEDEL